MSSPSRYRFRPRFKLLAGLAIAVGLGLVIATFVFSLEGTSRLFALACGAVGLVLGGLYLVSPTWNISVVIDEEALEVLSGADRRFRLPWSEVVRVVAAPSSSTCFVDGGHPERSLIVPGPGASAPYDIESRRELYAEILARVPPDKVIEVESLAAGVPEPEPLRQAQGEREGRQAQGEREGRQAQGEREGRQAQGEREGRQAQGEREGGGEPG